MRGLYAIIDADFLRIRGVPLLSFAERVVLAKPSIVQLRAKNAGARETLGWLRRLRELCDAASVSLFANDRPDLAVLSRCDGVHVGQDDLSVEQVRRFAPTLRVGVSTHDAEQLREALAQRPDYVAYGPVFATTSKADPSPVVGLDALAVASDLCRDAGVPLVAIGGIDVARAPMIRDRADMGAVISALLPEDGIDGVTERAATFGRLLRRP